METPPIYLRPPKRKACMLCTRSKRRCDKSAPQCIRCMEKGVVCRYPPSRRMRLVEVDEDTAGAESPPTKSKSPSPPTPTPPSSSRPLPVGGRDPLTNHRWFLDPDSFTCLHRDIIPDPNLAYGLSASYGEETLPDFISRVQGWLQSWSSTGHSPLIHRDLYRRHMPTTIQDAFTSLATYHAMTPATKATTLRIIENRAATLVASYTHASDLDQEGTAMVGASQDLEPLANAVVMLDTPTHVARTQALLIYAIIRLFDGDIRARAQAEDHIPVLDAWAAQMLDSARLDCAAAEMLGLQTDEMDTVQLEPTSSNPFALPHENTAAAAHAAWVLAESVRRTYLTSALTLAVYLTIKRGWAMCPGGLACMFVAGPWDAPTAHAWRDVVKRVVGDGKARFLLMQSLDTWRVFEEVEPAAVDGFGKAVLAVSHGLEGVVEMWETGGKALGRGVVGVC
ncbi:hypothetical protein B0T19DRAFT_383394 [Cercophora scortea]|uniref:Zn(2)-C6 fungal-type domain-containing protein n=1 Tax=Cercophora scortea TaxID=314031 RepID=A0AAE0IZN5_9PEZI|nr:hypothetical protein B0T19DRAFT_383394 [Cercophora scortea]